MANPAPEPQGPGPQVTSHEATEETTYILGERAGATVPIRKLYELAAKEMVGNDPRFTMSGRGSSPSTSRPVCRSGSNTT